MVSLYTKICVGIINFLEWLINCRSLIPIYNAFYAFKYLHPVKSLFIQAFPVTSFVFYLFYIMQFRMFKNLKLAFIADGNRRYLKKMNKDIEQVKKDGLEKINEIVEFCTHFNIPEVGFFCFSIKNFNRTNKEIQNVLQLLTCRPKISSCKIQVIGNMSFLPEEVSENMTRLMETTKNNKGTIVNLFIAYSSLDEVENGIKFKGEVDLIVRTSGEKRLSDFLILQCCKGTNIFFCDCLWPEITIFHVLLIIIKYRLEQIFFK